MWKLDNQIRTCLLALCGTYQYRNLIPESVSLLSWFRVFNIDLITGLSDEAPNNRPGCRGAVFDRGTHEVRSHRSSRSTKDPLCQRWGSGGGQSSAGNSHPEKSAPKWLLSPRRYRVSERVRRSGAHGLSRLPHTEHRQGNVMKVRDAHRLETLWDVSQVLVECWWRGGCYFYRR